MKYIDNKINANKVKLEEIDSKIKEKASKQELEIERKRIDSFTRLTAGSTTGDAELLDGRTGADGIIYNNIGGAIRGQVKDLKNDVELLGVKYSKLFTRKKLLPNTIVFLIIKNMLHY